MNVLKKIGEIITSPISLPLTPTGDEQKNTKFPILIFTSNAIFILTKSFFIKSTSTRNFFQEDKINFLFYILSKPPIYVLVTYILFFFFSIIVYLISKKLSKNASFFRLLISLMSLSIIGTIAHIAALPFLFIDVKHTNYVVIFLYIYTSTLTILSIKRSQKLSLTKSAVVFLISSSPFILSGYLLAISPYLIYLRFF